MRQALNMVVTDTIMLHSLFAHFIEKHKVETVTIKRLV